MSLPKNILYPVDFSERCRDAWPAVACMATKLGASVTLFHALDLDHLDTVDLRSELGTIRLRVWEKLDQFPTVKSNWPGLRRELAEGAAAACIVRRAETMEAPLIMMPTRGHTRFRQLLLGSVTAAVLHDAACPVWTEAHAENHVSPTGAFRSVMCAVDMGPHTPAVLQAASEFSQKFGAALTVAHSIPRGDARLSTALSNQAHALLVNTARNNFSLHCQKAGVDFPLEIVEDFALVDGIVGAIARRNADLLVIGRGVVQGTLGRLRTNAHNLIRRSPCPVLSI